MAIVKTWWSLPVTGSGAIGDDYTADTYGFQTYCLNPVYVDPQRGTCIAFVAMNDTDVAALDRKPRTTFYGFVGDPAIQAQLDQFCDANGLARINLSGYDCQPQV